MNSGKSVFSSTLKIQEWLTPGYAAAKSVNRIPDSCGAHATWARAAGSLYLENVIRHLSGGDTSLRGVYASHGVPVKSTTYCCGEYLAIAIAQRQRA